MEHFSQISQEPGWDFEIQKLGKHLGIHLILSENTHVCNKASPELQSSLDLLLICLANLEIYPQATL